MSGQTNQTFLLDDGVQGELKVESNVRGEVRADFLTAPKRPQIYAALAASLGAYIMGTTFGWSSSVQLDLMRRPSAKDRRHSVWYMRLNEHQMSWVGSLVNIGGLVGSLCGGFLMDRFGRRRTLMAMTVPYIIGWILITLAVDPSMLYIGRIVCGIAAGVCSAAAPSYINEISTPNVRGLVGTFFSFSFCCGVFVTSLLAWLNWRWVSAISAVQPLFLVTAMYFVPETPYFLIKQGRLEQAEKALTWLRGSDYHTATELQQIKEKVQANDSIATSFTDILRPWAYKPVTVGVAVMVLQQFSGLSPAVFYSVEIFRLADSRMDPAVSSVIIKAVMVVMNFPTMILIDRIGRRALFASSEAVVCISLFVLGTYFYILGNDSVRAASLAWLPLTALIIFIASVSFGVVPLAWLVSNEVLPARYRSTGSSIAAFTNWLTAFIVTKTFVNMQANLTTAGTFWLYGAFCFTGVLFGFFIMPETKGKTLAEIQAFFDENESTPDDTEANRSNETSSNATVMTSSL